ncbi:MAG: hypothetical protein V4642_01230, partial [Bacteroidota bacterium]
TKFFRPYCLVYLDQQLLQAKSKSCYSINKEANQYLKQCGFEFLSTSAEFCEPFPDTYIIKLKRFKGNISVIESDIINWIQDDIICLFPAIPSSLKKAIGENLFEIINNSIFHGANENGISIAGQFYPQKSYCEIAFYDAGVGIPKLVREFDSNFLECTDCQCIEWAIQNYNSTRNLDDPGGIGLNAVRTFLQKNNGTFQMVSGNGYYAENIDGITHASHTLLNNIDGTLVNLRIVIDLETYSLQRAI